MSQLLSSCKSALWFPIRRMNKIRRIIKKIKGQHIDTRTKEKRIERCPNLLHVFTKQVLETAFFRDEKIFKVTQLLNVQNLRTYAPSAYNKSTIKNKRLYSTWNAAAFLWAL